MTPSAQIPFATATLARILVAQGKLDAAESVVRRLLEQTPEDRALAAVLEEITRRRDMQRALDTAAREADWVELTPVASQTVRCRFRLSRAGVHRAELVAEAAGEPVVRFCTYPEAPSSPPADTRLSFPGETASAIEGALDLGYRAGARMGLAAAGLLTAGGHFVAIAHSDGIALTSSPS